MIYDCFILNDEIDLLWLRLEYLSPLVDKFVIIEAEYSFTGNTKPLHFKNNRERFRKFEDKIIYASIPFEHYIKDNPWQNEYFQRNFIKTQLTSLKDDDIVHVSDVDEIPDLYAIFKRYTIDRPYLIELLVYYYFINLKSKISFKVNLITPYSFIKDMNIGRREDYFDLTDNFIELKDMHTGWHFSYLFGYNIGQYQNKLNSFSHQEYNNPHFNNPKRLRASLSIRADILERNSVYEAIDIERELPARLKEALHTGGLYKNLVYQNPGLPFYLDPYNFKYYLKYSVKPRLKSWLDKRLKTK